MARGVKTGGRQKGAANKKTREIADKAAQEGVTPLEYMLTIMREPFPPELKDAVENGQINAEAVAAIAGWHAKRFEAAKAAAPYIHPKLQTTTVQGDKDKPLNHSVEIHIVDHRTD